jgi:hypothetical protein
MDSYLELTFVPKRSKKSFSFLRNVPLAVAAHLETLFELLQAFTGAELAGVVAKADTVFAHTGLRDVTLAASTTCAKLILVLFCR